MAPSASLLVPFEVDASRKVRPLQSDVQQIVKQKGAFRHVTEESLSNSIAKPDEPSQDDHSIQSTDTEPETVQVTRERLFASRAEVNKLLQSSMNETNTLLDLVSWVLSGRSKVAQTTMSPALKGGVPIGSAEVRNVPPPHYSVNTRRRLDDTSNIVRLQAFQKCSESLQAASDRLQMEGQQQSRYWDQMANIRSQGWPISRLPRDGRSLVVHVASTEAPARYRNKGLLSLRRDENGDLTLPDMQHAGRQCRLAVQIRRRDKVTGYFQDQRGFIGSGSVLEDALVRAKVVAFEEEAFSEASREAQLMANLGARVRSNSIDIDITPECSISITYLPQSLRGDMHSHVDDEIAAFTAISLRIMLVAEHQSRYRTRATALPTIMVSNPRPSSEYVLLRPIVAQLRHNVNAGPIHEDLKAYQMSLDSAGLTMSTVTRTTAENNSPSVSLQNLRQITTSNLTIGLPSGKALAMDIETQLAPPRFGTQFSSEEYRSSCGACRLPPTTSSEATTLFLADVIARDVCCTILDFRHKSVRWQVRSLFPLELVLLEGANARALITTSCRSGSLAVSMLRLAGNTTEKMVFNRNVVVIVQGDGQRKDSKKSLKDMLDVWVEDSLKPQK